MLLLIGKIIYIKKMDDILSDQKKFSKVSLIYDTLLNFATLEFQIEEEGRIKKEAGKFQPK